MTIGWICLYDVDKRLLKLNVGFDVFKTKGFVMIYCTQGETGLDKFYFT